MAHASPRARNRLYLYQYQHTKLALGIYVQGNTPLTFIRPIKSQVLLLCPVETLPPIVSNIGGCAECYVSSQASSIVPENLAQLAHGVDRPHNPNMRVGRPGLGTSARLRRMNQREQQPFCSLCLGAVGIHAMMHFLLCRKISNQCATCMPKRKRRVLIPFIPHLQPAAQGFGMRNGCASVLRT